MDNLLNENKILLLDGAMGTEIQKLHPTENDFPDQHDGFNDGLFMTRPDWISKIHKDYLIAGADCIETNTFSSNKLKLDEYGYGNKTIEFNKNIALLAVNVCKEFSTADHKRYVLGSMGPTGFLPSSNDPDLGNKPLHEIRSAFELQAEGLIYGGVDALLIETSQDILEVKLAIEASHNAMKKTIKKIPVFANITLDQYGKMLLGTNVQAAYTIISSMHIDAFGLNCSTGPTEMIPSIDWLNENSSHPLLIVPNAGMPKNENGYAVYDMSPNTMTKTMTYLINKYNKLKIIGGCCGTNYEHIKLLRKIIDNNSTFD